MKKAGIMLKELRKKYKISGIELSELLECSPQFVYAIENGKKRFPFQKIDIIKNLVSETDYFNFLNCLEKDEDTNIIKEEKLKIRYIGQIKQKKIPFFPDIQASAGYGCLNEDETELEFIEVPEELAKPGNIAIRVFGESMEPEIKDGDTIVIETKCVECIKNKIIVVNYQGAVYLKKYVEEGNSSYLVSINPYYPKIRVVDKAEFRVIGRLKGVMRYY